MLLNIIDSRKNKYRWQEVNAVIEDTSHDNSCKNSEKTDPSPDEDYVGFEQRESISINEAIKWAENCSGKVTLFLYDKGDGIS